MDLQLIETLKKSADSKILLLVLDGLGGAPTERSTLTALETARTPHLDGLAEAGICGLHDPVGPGITPGSGPAHLGVLGYDPLRYRVGRGVLAALGIGFDLRPGDVAARGNFCTVDEDGRVTDRRAGRISSELNRELCEELRGIGLEGAQVFVETVKEHRLLLVLRGEGLSQGIADTDPKVPGEKWRSPEPLSPDAEGTARLLRQFVEEAGRRLGGRAPANMLILRGFSSLPDWPTFPRVFGVRAACIAGYPMYRGLATLLGMEVLESGEAIEEKMAVLRKAWKDFDFFFVHVKATDSSGEDGDFERKVSTIEEVDRSLPGILELEPDVVVVTGDHSTPCALKSHSWHPVPVLLWSRRCRPDNVRQFGERSCVAGALGPRIPAVNLMPIALANALRLSKFGA